MHPYEELRAGSPCNEGIGVIQKLLRLGQYMHLPAGLRILTSEKTGS